VSLGPVVERSGAEDLTPLHPPARALFTLLGFVVVVDAKRPEVGLVEEEGAVAAVRGPVVGDQEGGVGFELAAAWPLAGEAVAGEDAPAQALPFRGRIPGAAWLRLKGMALGIPPRGNPWRERGHA
jgi:hypothetical protein